MVCQLRSLSTSVLIVESLRELMAEACRLLCLCGLEIDKSVENRQALSDVS